MPAESTTRIASQQAGDAKLVRVLGVPSLAANIVNTTIGASIFVLPGTMAKMLGGAAPLAFLVCAVAQAIFVTCFAMAGSRVSLTGGLYAYVEVAFGRYVGFLAGLMNFTTAILGVSAVMNVLVDAAAALSPLLAGGVSRFLMMLVILAALAAMNVRSVRAGAGAVSLVTLIKVLPLVVFVAVGIFFIKPGALTLVAPAHNQSLGNSVLLLMFAFFGIESSLTPSGEVRNPARTVPRAIYLALGLTTVIYLLIQLVAQGTLGVPRLAANTAAPLAESASVFLGHFGRLLLLVGATVSSFGYVASDILNSPRTLFAFGRDGILPRSFAHVHRRFHSPDVAIVFYAAIALTLSLISTFEGLAVMANVAALLLYLLCSAAAWQLRRRDVRTDGKPFHVPGAPVFIVMAIALIVWMLAHATMKEVKVLGIVLAVGSALYFVRTLTAKKAPAA
ncbi:MAG: APC family permease [Verrucomicrobiota bacterium]|nr:APC family permease [Verrucomicrobiota bacterium]